MPLAVGVVDKFQLKRSSPPPPSPPPSLFPVHQVGALKDAVAARDEALEAAHSQAADDRTALQSAYVLPRNEPGLRMSFQ